MKNLKFILAITLLSGTFFTAFSQTGVDSVNNDYKKGVNQNPSMNDNQNINNNSNQSPTYEFDKDKTSPGQNSPSDYKIYKEDSVTLYKKGGTLINTDSTSQYPVNGPSDKTFGGTQTSP